MRRLVVVCILFELAAAHIDLAVAVEPPHRAASAAIYQRLKVSVGYHYSFGHYGNSEPTQINYVPLVVTGDIDRWRLQATIPYLNISGPAGFAPGPGGVIETIDGTSDGLGDLLARLSYLVPISKLLPEAYASRVWVPFVDVIGLVKFPTASRSDGLGTGEFDFGIEGELTWVFGPFMPFAGVGYRFLGSPPGSHLDNVLVASGGATYRFLSTLTAGVLLDYRQAPTPDIGQQLDLVPYVSWLFYRPWSVDAYISAGLADGSPDVGTGLQVGYTW